MSSFIFLLTFEFLFSTGNAIDAIYCVSSVNVFNSDQGHLTPIKVCNCLIVLKLYKHGICFWATVNL